MTTKHTPTPWVAYPAEIVTGGTVQCVGSIREHRKNVTAIAQIQYCGNSKEDEANAAFIVRACNSHDALVSALETIVLAYECDNPTRDAPIIKTARAALKLAKGE